MSRKSRNRKHTLILDYEEQFAKVVAFKIRASHSKPVWHFFVPFMMVFEYLATKKAFGLFVRNFLFVKKLALDAARDTIDAEDRQNTPAEMETRIKEWLSTHTLFSPNLHRKQTALAKLLFEHYSLLFRAEGKRYEHLVKNAYVNRTDYESFLQKLSAIENEIDHIVVQMRGETAELKSQISVKQEGIHTLRTKETNQIFKR
jgi:hypothetical protein